MKDRRGHGNQAVLSQVDDSEIPASGGGHAPPADSSSDIGAAPELSPAGLDSQPSMPATAAAEGIAEAPASAPVAAASASPAMAGTDAPEADGAPYQSSASAGPQPAANGPAIADGGGPGATAASGGATGPSYSAPAAGGGEASGSYAGDDMGWDAAAFAEAGGYDAVISGALPPGMCPGDGDGQDVFIFIDELNVDIINNTLVQTTEINLIADDGSVIDIGGDFTAIQTQESLIQDGPAFASPGADPAFIPQEASLIEADAVMA